MTIKIDALIAAAGRVIDAWDYSHNIGILKKEICQFNEFASTYEERLKGLTPSEIAQNSGLLVIRFLIDKGCQIDFNLLSTDIKINVVDYLVGDLRSIVDIHKGGEYENSIEISFCDFKFKFSRSGLLIGEVRSFTDSESFDVSLLGDKQEKPEISRIDNEGQKRIYFACDHGIVKIFKERRYGWGNICIFASDHGFWYPLLPRKMKGEYSCGSKVNIFENEILMHKSIKAESMPLDFNKEVMLEVFHEGLDSRGAKENEN